jgi:GNAT superfamily N-acetyltransferase
VSVAAQFTHLPPLPRAIDARITSFLQRIELRDGRITVGHAAWHLTDLDEGVVQLVDLTIEPKLQRRGHAGAMLNEAIAQATALCKLKRVPLRRLWVALEQKSQVLARAFLTKHGFHHTSSVPDLLRDQDLLVYVRSFD